VAQHVGCLPQDGGCKGALLFHFQLFDGDGFFLWINVCNFLEDIMKGFNQV
jgi:hypothetical protein